MVHRLRKSGLLQPQTKELEINISLAWDILSRLGLPARFGGKSLDGAYEYIVIDPSSGNIFASGRGTSLEDSMCEAALDAKNKLNASQPQVSGFRPFPDTK